jgi:hypothetical protein
MISIHTQDQLHILPGSALKVCVVVVVESEFSDRLWLSFSLALAKPNKMKLNLTSGLVFVMFIHC